MHSFKWKGTATWLQQKQSSHYILLKFEPFKQNSDTLTHSSLLGQGFNLFWIVKFLLEILFIYFIFSGFAAFIHLAAVITMENMDNHIHPSRGGIQTWYESHCIVCLHRGQFDGGR